MKPGELLQGSRRQSRQYRANFAAARRAHLIALWRAALFAALVILAGCSALPAENATVSPAPANYGVLVSNNLKTFKDWQGFTNFEISDLRWAHVTIGWVWLACVRYDDHGHRRTYVFFIKDNAVVYGRYDIMTDGCGAQTYRPLDVATGAIKSPAPEQQPPLY